MGAPPHDLTSLRARLAGQSGPALWRSFDALADTPAFRNFLASEFPAASKLADGPDRRTFLRLMAASFAMAGLAACDATDGRVKEVPYVRNPERIEPGANLSYASSTVLDGIANGVLVTTRNGRPLKIEGNPQHPWSRGGTDPFMQASILGLYDPSRSQTVRYLNRISTWQAFRGVMTGRFAALRSTRGQGLALLTGAVTSPSLLAQIDRVQADFPSMRVFVHETVSREAGSAATERAFGQRLEPRWAFDKADVVVAFDGDFLDPGPRQVGLSRAYVDARRAAAQRGSLLELHSAASTPSLTSAKSDRHIALDPDALVALAADLVTAVDGPAEALQGADPRARWLAEAAQALRGARGRSIVLAGAGAPPAVQEAVHRLNAALGNIGQTVTFTQELLPRRDGLTPLVEAMRRGEVSTLVMLDTDPVRTAPADLAFTDALAHVEIKLHAGLFVDATAVYADWHLPLAHPLESWGDARSPDGTVGLIQPTVAPLYDGRSAPEIVSLLADLEPRDGRTLLESHWRGQQDAATFDPTWRQALIDGFLPDTAFPTVSVALAPATTAAAQVAPPREPGLDLVFRPDPTVWDGSFVNNGWLQELPKPLTKITWENPVAISPTLAERQGLAQGDIVRVAVGEASIEGPVWILPGQAPETVTLFLGYGLAAPDLIGSGLGYNACALQTASEPARRAGATLEKTGRRIRFATTQDHSTLEGHDLVRVQPVGAPALGGRGEALPSLLPSQESAKADDGRAWGMVIDEDACIGCNACVVACQSENNIPIVGREQVALGREMHWLRIDRYYSGLKGGGGLDDPDTHFQPVPCMHCEDAPCEVPCPVEATVHDHEGLNLMVYNRCVGTRACSGYCPYKVRHFNYLDYTDAAPSLEPMRNPTVTVRAKGVMEKCTYCVQRIADARITADKVNAPIADGQVQTACQGACPTRAITFGDLKDPASAVAAARQDPRHYALLGELNLRPRTTYLAERGPATPTGKG